MKVITLAALTSWFSLMGSMVASFAIGELPLLMQ
jgi:hypothetical protein